MLCELNQYALAIEMEDQLTEIGIEDLIRLRDLYLPDGKKSYTAFVTIDNFLRWNGPDRLKRNENIKFFCLNGNISGGTFVVVVSFIEISKRSSQLQKILNSYPFLGKHLSVCRHIA